MLALHGQQCAKLSRLKDGAPRKHMSMKEIKFSDVLPGPIRHPGLPLDLIERIKSFKQILAEVETSTLENAIENFQRDQHPECEVAVWERIAAAYHLYFSENPSENMATKTDVYRVLLGASMGTEDFDNTISHLTHEQINEVISYFSRSSPAG